MKLNLPDDKLINKKQIIIYSIIIAICIISFGIAFYVQFYGRIDLGRVVGIQRETTFGNKTEEEKQTLISSFDELYTNNLINLENQGGNKKQDANKEIVYTQLEKKVSKVNSYDIEVRIPKINIKGEVVDKFNKELDVFIQKTNEILEGENQNIIYTVDYVANIQDDILSVMIRSNLKQGTNAQRVIIETFNYDLRNDEEISLDKVLNIEYVDKQQVQNEIINKVEIEQKKAEDLNALGYNIYTRDSKSDEYKIENTKQFYLTDKVLYIIYPYGNENYTSEVDIIVI